MWTPGIPGVEESTSRRSNIKDVRSPMTKLENQIAEAAQCKADTKGTLEALLESGSATIQ